MDIVSYQGRVWHAAGGTAGNVAAVLGFLGWQASLIADLGDDPAGEAVVRDLARANVATDAIRLRADLRTPRVVHQIDGARHKFLFRCPSCATSLPRSRPLNIERAEQIVESAVSPDVFFFDRVNAGTLVLAEHFAKSACLVVFEPGRPANEDRLRRAMAVADVVKMAHDRPTGIESAELQASQVQIVTLGSEGARFRIGKGTWHVSPAFPFPIVDTGGAGDWTTAGLVHALPDHGRRTMQTVSDALRWAQALAAVSCGAPGARGLARQQSAEAVVRTVRFMATSQNPPTVTLKPSLRSRTKPRNGNCSWCLQQTSIPGDRPGATPPRRQLRTGNARREVGG
jgi:fructokinase